MQWEDVSSSEDLTSSSKAVHPSEAGPGSKPDAPGAGAAAVTRPEASQQKAAADVEAAGEPGHGEAPPPPQPPPQPQSVSSTIMKLLNQTPAPQGAAAKLAPLAGPSGARAPAPTAQSAAAAAMAPPLPSVAAASPFKAAAPLPVPPAKQNMEDAAGGSRRPAIETISSNEVVMDDFLTVSDSPVPAKRQALPLGTKPAAAPAATGAAAAAAPLAAGKAPPPPAQAAARPAANNYSVAVSMPPPRYISMPEITEASPTSSDAPSGIGIDISFGELSPKAVAPSLADEWDAISSQAATEKAQRLQQAQAAQPPAKQADATDEAQELIKILPPTDLPTGAPQKPTAAAAALPAAAAAKEPVKQELQDPAAEPDEWDRANQAREKEQRARQQRQAAVAVPEVPATPSSPPAAPGARPIIYAEACADLMNADIQRYERDILDTVPKKAPGGFFSRLVCMFQNNLSGE